MSKINVNVKGPWIQTVATILNANLTNPATEGSVLGNAADVCNNENIYNTIHYVGFSITCINALGMFMAGVRLNLPYMFQKPGQWKNVYKPLLIACLSVLVFQPLVMFCWTLCFRENLHERDQLAVILASALPTWTFSFHFVRWSGGHIEQAKRKQKK